jgi:hypothetical protein
MSFTSTISPLALVALFSFAASFISPPASAADLFANKSIDLLVGAPPANCVTRLPIPGQRNHPPIRIR